MQAASLAKGRGRRRCRDGAEGTDFVRCRICGKHLRVISGRHLSTHGTNRETYIKEYRLSPDKLCSKSFRINHSSRRDYHNGPEREGQQQVLRVYFGGIYDNVRQLLSAQIKRLNHTGT